MEKAIKKAIEGEYKILRKTRMDNYLSSDVNKALLDPLFWQALGKAEGWDKHSWGGKVELWKFEWHRFTDHLASGKDINSFFEELLK